MATLNSPGVSVTVIDESFYTPAAPGTVPMLFVTSAQDKKNASGTIAAGTTAANAGKVWLMTSQRDLADTFGVPQFYTDSSSNPLHGDELNEYGLQAAYSLLGVSSRAYIVRADVDTSSLIPTSSIPEGAPNAGQYWVDTNASLFGIKEWNNVTLTFTDKTPIVLNDDSDLGLFSSSNPEVALPNVALGQNGEYCIIITKYGTNRLYYKNAGTWEAVIQAGKNLYTSPHYDVPLWTNATPDKSVWIVTTTPNNGANWKVKRYNSSAKSWDNITAPIYDKVLEATAGLDSKGGLNISIGSIFIETNYNNNAANPEANFKLWRRANSGVTSIVSSGNGAKSAQSTYTFTIKETTAGTKVWSSPATVTISNGGNVNLSLASLVPAAIAVATGLTNITAIYNAVTDKVTITHKLGGDFELTEGTNSPLSTIGFINYGNTNATDNLYLPAAGDSTNYLASNWKPLVYEAKDDAPYTTPADGQMWYSSVHDEVDIMYHNGTTWVGYLSQFPASDPNGPIVSATAPDKDTGQSDGSALVNGDIWISTADMERYGKDIYVYSTTSGWIKQDVTDQSTSNGWLFADARWASSGSTLTPSPIITLLSSGYLDPDAPDPAVYPRGMRLFNTRRSGFNVKKYVSGYINITANSGLNTRFGDQSMETYKSDRWVSQYNVAADGSGAFGRFAQRAQIVAALKSTIDTNAIIRDTDTINFNLMAAPSYPEAIQNMVAFNIDRGQTAFIIGDTPFRLKPTGTELSNWGLNTALALDNGDNGATTYDEYLALYYPSGYTNDNTGNYIVVPPSHMMLRTFINSDAKSFQWFAPAGTRRGGVDNATSVGYITSEGEFKTTALPQGIRDVMQSPSTKVAINPIATLTGVGVVAYGQRTRAKNASALDRVNVARLVCYLRRQLDVLARPFLFEPNDAQTRREIKAAAESLMLELVGQRALYDYIVVCDETNNTPARIDRSELYMDIAIEPVKAVEFIYIPLRLKNTGDIKAGL